MRTSKNDKVDISTLMQSVDNSETLNTETDKIASLIDATTHLNKCLLSIVEQLKNITSQPIGKHPIKYTIKKGCISFQVKQPSMVVSPSFFIPFFPFVWQHL